MGQAKDLWIAELERAEEDFALGKSTQDEFGTALIRLGFSTQEIDEIISTVESEHAA